MEVNEKDRNSHKLTQETFLKKHFNKNFPI